MTIKSIKEKYKDYRIRGNGKVVIVVNAHPHKDIGKYVTQVIRVSDGKELLKDGSCRPCDNLDDAIDVAGEMM